MARDPAENLPANITAHSSALIALDSDIRGTVTFGPGCIVHPKAVIYALNGSIAFGKDSIVEETAKIIYRGGEVMRIGEGNIFMVGCHVESPTIGDHNTFQPRSFACEQVEVSDHCTISAGTRLEPSLDLDSVLDIAQSIETTKTKDRLEPYTVIYGTGSDRRKWDGKHWEAENNLRVKHLEYLREILPKYNRMRPV